MNKKIFLTLLVPLALVACNPTNNGNSSSTDSTDSESSNTSSETSLPSVDAPTSVSDLYKMLKTTSLDLEITHGRSAERNSVVAKAVLFATSYETSHEVYHSYSDELLDVSGELKYEKVPSDEYGEAELFEDTFKGVSGVVDNNFYQILDYEKENKYSDDAKKYAMPGEVNEQTAEKFTTNGLSLMLVNYFDTYIIGEIVEGADAINPEIAANGDFTYVYQLAYNDVLEYETISTVVDLEVSFTAAGMMKYYHFKVTENSSSEDWEGNTVTQLVQSIDETFTCTDLSAKKAHESLLVNPLDYFLTDYDIQLLADDGMGMEDSLTPIDAKKIPIDTKLQAEVINPTPEKALDTDLTIIASSDPSVVEVTTYEGSDSYVKAIGLGDATLTIKSESGIEKTIDVTIISLPLESISVNIYGSVLEGDKVSVYVAKNPDTSLDEIAAKLSCDESIATVTTDEDGDFVINALKPAEGITLTVYSVSNPEIKGEVTFDIYKKYTYEEISEAIKDSVWVSHYENSSATIAFNADGTGHFSVTNNESYGSVFVENEKYEFTYTMEEHEDGYPGDVTITLSAFTVTSEYSEYNFNDNLVVLDYSMHSLDVRLTPEGESGWQFSFQYSFFIQ